MTSLLSVSLVGVLDSQYLDVALFWCARFFFLLDMMQVIDLQKSVTELVLGNL